MGKLLSKSKSKNSRHSDYGTNVNQNSSQPTTIRQFQTVHTEAVTSLNAVPPNMLLSGSKDQCLLLTDFTSGKVTNRWTGHSKEITKVCHGLHISSVFSASRDKTARMWSLTNHDCQQIFEEHELVVMGLSVNPENSLLCTGSRDNYMIVWDVETGRVVMKEFISRNLVTHVKWSATSDIIAQTSEDKEVRIWDARSLKVVQSFPRKQYIQTCCDLSRDGVYCLTCSNGFGGQGCELTLWDLRTTQPVCEFRGHGETVNSCMFLPAAVGTNLIASSSSDGSVKVWDQNSRDCVASVNIPGSGPITSLAAYDNGKLCAGTFNEGIHVLSLCLAGEAYALSREAQF